MHQIGVGVLGPVYRTHDPDADRLVALKAFQLDLTPEQSSALVAALTGIVRAGLSHPAIVIPVGAGLSDGVPYLALEYVAAESLDVAIRHFSSVSLDTVLPVVVQLAEAIDAAHAKGLVHGALHLRDVFVTHDLPRITGFGVVAALELVGLHGPLRRPYTAPEQIAGGHWGPAADRFALAAIAQQLLTGKRAASSGVQVTDRLAVALGNDTTRLARFFAAALADKPEARPKSARLFADQLAEAVGWTGADAVRTVLDGMGRQANMDAADELDRRREDHAPVTVVSGASARLSAGVDVVGVEVSEIEKTSYSVANIREPKSKSTPAFDWTERTLDRGEADELVPTETYQPRSPGRVAPGKLLGYSDRDGYSDFDRIDRALPPTPDDLTVFAVATEAGDGSDLPNLDLDLTLVSQETLTEGQSDIDATGVSWSARGEPPHTRVPARHEASEVAAEFQRTAEDDDNVSDDWDVELEVVQARYRRVGAFVSADEAAPGVYSGITLSDKPDLLGVYGEPLADDSHGAVDLAVQESAATDGDSFHERKDDTIVVHGPDQLDDFQYAPTLPFASDAAYGEQEDYEKEEHLKAGLAAEGWIPRGARRSMVLLGVVVVVVAFATGFGWVTDPGDPAKSGDTVEIRAASERAPAEIAVGRGLVESPSSPTQEFSVTPTERVREETVSSQAEVSLQGDEPAPGQGDVAPVAEETPLRRPPTTPAVAESRGEQPSVTGRLLLRSTPPGVEVILNGEVRGMTPLVVSELGFGNYDVRLRLEGYESQNFKFSLASENTIEAINADLVRLTETQRSFLGVGSVLVDTRPRGAEVWLDRRLVGETPMLISNIPAGVHVIEFRYDGYRDWVTTVQVDLSAQARVTASLDHVPR